MSLPNTSLTLLEVLQCRPNNTSWNRLNAIYGPIIIAFAVSRGLDESSARDVLQETLIVLHTKLPEFDRSRSRFSTWLLGIANKKVYKARDFLTARGRAVSMEANEGESPRTHWLHNIPDETTAPDELAGREWQRAILAVAFERVRTKLKNRSKVDAFRALVLEAMPVPDVAAKFELSENSVYQLRFQIMRMLSEEIATFEAPPVI